MVTLSTPVKFNINLKRDKLAILSLMAQFNAVCNYVSQIAFKERIFNKFRLSKRLYRTIKDRYNLTSAEALAIIREVARAYERCGVITSIIRFRRYRTILLLKHIYRDDRIRFYKLEMPITCDVPLPRKAMRGYLSYKNNKLIIHQYIGVEEQSAYKAQGYLGCDLGIKNILTDSNGKIYSGAHLNNFKKRNQKIKARLKLKGTRSAYRLLKKRQGKEMRFSRDIDHQIAKDVVIRAKKAFLGIALENLKGITLRGTRFGKANRYLQRRWAFNRLTCYLQYKSKLNGVPLVMVDARNTSRTCPICGYIDKRNRKSQAWFKCIKCGYGHHADTVAAINISRRADGNQPYAPPKSDVQMSSIINIEEIVAT